MRHALIAALVAVSAASGLIAADTEIAVRNSLTAKALVEAAASAYESTHPGVGFRFSEGNTTTCFKGVIAGDVPLVSTVRPPKDEEKAACPELQVHPIALDALVLVVNAANPVTSITSQQVADIYTGKITSWKALGGEDLAPVPVARNEAFATLELFETSFGIQRSVQGEGATKAMFFAPKGGSPGTVKALTPGSNNDALVRCVTNPAGITFASLGNVQAQKAKGMSIKALALDGVEPTAETVSSKRYGVRRTLYLITKGAPSGEIKGFIAFVTSAEGQKVVADKEFIPLGK